MFVPYYKFLKNSFNVNGRTSRKDFWCAVLVLFVQVAITLFVIESINGNYSEHIVETYEMLTSLWFFYNLIPLFTMSVRRLHDINISGTVMILFFLFSFVYIGIIAYLVFMATKADNRNNKYQPE